MNTIVIAEDDRKLNDGIMLALRNQNVHIIQCHNYRETAEYLEKENVELLILDINYNDGNGLDILKQIKRDLLKTRVIILTANNMETDIVTGLELGADDYITKPFSLMVLRARVNVQLRAIEEQQKENTVQHFVRIDELEFDFEKMVFKNKGQLLELSKTEQRLLKIFVKNKGIVLTRDRLIDCVWNQDTEYVDEHALTVTIKRLRDKLGENPSNPQYIKTVYGIGYIWAV